MRLPDYWPGDDPHQGSSYPAQSSSTDHYQPGTYLFGRSYDFTIFPS
jgi:hypothetical protein